MAGDHDDVRLRRFLPQLAQRFEAVDSRQPDIEQHEVIGVVLDLLQTVFTGRDGFGGEAFVFEDAF